jgi:hypothetical protein
MSAYIDILMTNRVDVSDSSEDTMFESETPTSKLTIKSTKKRRNTSQIDTTQKGGSIDVDMSNIPMGSFPPLYIVDKKQTPTNDDDVNNRGFTNNKTILPIGEIMKDRQQEVKPFISL